MYLPDEPKDGMQKNILSRLKKIEGQVRGLHGMVSNDRECESILTQLRAAQSALKSVTALVLKNYLTKCYRELDEKQSFQDLCHKLEKTVAMMTRFI
jgi:CsoR family transcriptional regulator, copper-sensing transcriptional repressor